MQEISRDGLKTMLNQNHVELIEVLPPEQYKEFHLPGAINIPLGDDFDKRIQQAVPDKSGHVVVYCLDAECQASPKAARRMEELGYQQVYDYEAGKEDWKAAGLPIDT